MTLAATGLRYRTVCGHGWTLALVGGGEWRDGCDFDAELLAAAGTDEVVVLPTAAAYEHPEPRGRAGGALVRGPGRHRAAAVRAVDRSGARDDANVAAVRDARFVYLSDGSPMHLRSVLLQTPLWEALLAAWHGGAVVAGSAAGATVLCDPMVDPRGGAFTLGPRARGAAGRGPPGRHVVGGQAPPHPAARPHRLPLVGVDERTALIRDADGTWRSRAWAR